MTGVKSNIQSVLMTLVATLALCLSAGATRSAQANARDATTRPNILLIVADDLGWADVGYHGSPIRTPHIDRLAREGVELDQHYVAPLCTPTRAALLTGRYWSRFGNTAPSNERVLPWKTWTLARALKSAGYVTCITGKWKLVVFRHKGGDKAELYDLAADPCEKNDLSTRHPQRVTTMLKALAAQVKRDNDALPADKD